MSKKFYPNPPKKVLAAFREDFARVKERKEKGEPLTRLRWPDWSFGQFAGEVAKAQRWARKQMYQQYLKSDEWLEKRNAVLKRDDGKCMFCGAKAQAVHHLSYDRIFNESLYDLISVCKDCHTAIHYDGK